jgi:hypothetical protein
MTKYHISLAAPLLFAACVLSLREFEQQQRSNPDSRKSAPDGSKQERAIGGDRMPLLTFDGPEVPRNKAGDEYPRYYYDPNGRKEGGKFTASINNRDAVVGKCLQLNLTEGALYAQFNPWDKVWRGFARDYVHKPSEWRFNTYNRMQFWIRAPSSAPLHKTDGTFNVEIGTYVKRLKDPDNYNDETGGGHYYHQMNIPATGQWTKVVLNAHPNHRRGESGAKDHGFLSHPTGEEAYNYFDTLTRFYIQYFRSPSTYPAVHLLDEFEFVKEPRAENDDQVYSLCASYVPDKNRLIITWSHRKDQLKIPHEIRYSFKDIHALGWAAAQSAPKGIVFPSGNLGYNGMTYDTTELPLAGRSDVFVAIKPRNSELFTQVAIPLFKK